MAGLEFSDTLNEFEKLLSNPGCAQWRVAKVLHEVDIQDLTNMETVWFTFLEKVMGEETTLLGLVLLIGDVVATGSGAPRNSQWSQIYRGKWTDTTIRAILVNPLYIGDMVWNRRTDGRFHRISAGRAVDRECA
jgi:hypothetical protein